MSAEAPFFTVVMNVYNGERWLAQTLRSLFAQTWTDWELLFYDDRSSDGSAALLRPYAGDPRVRYVLADEQVPLGKARELAIAAARGEWLAFLDQDDLWTADKLSLQADVIARWQGGPLAIVYGRAMKFGAVAQPAPFDHWHEFGPLPQGDIFESLFVDGCFICQSAVCLRTEAARAVGPMPAEHRYCPDYYYYTALAERYAAACTEQVVCWYRIHAGAMSRERYVEVLQEMLSIVDRWQHRLPPAVVARRRRIQHSMMALRRLRSGPRRLQGAHQLLADGSLAYLAARPFARLLRALRRRLAGQGQGHGRHRDAPPPLPAP